MGILDIIYFLRERKFAFADYTTKGYNSTLLYYILYFNTKKNNYDILEYIDIVIH